MVGKLKIKTSSKWEQWRVATFYNKEPETIAWIKNFDGGIFWDIGANIGVFSLWCAYKHPLMTIHAFEPMRSNFLRLWENIFLNNHINTTAHFVAIGRTGGRDAFFRVPRTEVGASGGQIDIHLPTAIETYAVPVMCGDQITALYGLPSYIKIDTDGNECDILHGMPQTLSASTLKSVLVEVNGDDDEIDQLMAAAGLFPDKTLNSLKTRSSDFNIIYTRR